MALLEGRQRVHIDAGVNVFRLGPSLHLIRMAHPSQSVLRSDSWGTVALGVVVPELLWSTCPASVLKIHPVCVPKFGTRRKGLAAIIRLHKSLNQSRVTEGQSLDSSVKYRAAYLDHGSHHGRRRSVSRCRAASSLGICDLAP